MTKAKTTALSLLLLAVGCADHDDGADDPLASKGSHTSGDLETTSSTGDEGSSSGEDGSSSSTGGDMNVRPSMGTFSYCWDGHCDPHFRCLEGQEEVGLDENGEVVYGKAYDLCVWEDCESDDECPTGPGGQKGVCTVVGDSEELWDTCMLSCPSQSDAGCPKDMRCIELDTWVCV